MHYAIRCGLVSAVCVLLSVVAKYLAPAPGLFSPVWPIAGIGLAVVLAYGYRYLPAVFLAAIAVSVSHILMRQGELTLSWYLLIPICTAVGIVLQCFIISVLLRVLGCFPLVLCDAKQIIIFFVIAGPLGAWVNPLYANFIYYVIGMKTWDEFLFVAFNCWVGNILSIVVLTPIALCLIAKPRRVWGMRQLTLALPLSLLVLGMNYYYLSVRKQGEGLVHQKINEQSEVILEEFRQHKAISYSIINSIQSFYNSSKFVDRAEFSTFTRPLYEKNSFIDALAWMPRVTESGARQLIAQAKNDGVRNFSFHTGASAKIPADEFYPVFYVAPVASKKDSLGFILSNVSTYREAIKQAVRQDKPMSALRKRSESHYECIIFAPVFKENKAGDEELQGMIAAMLNIESFFAKTGVGGLKQKGFEYSLGFKNNKGQFIPLFGTIEKMPANQTVLSNIEVGGLEMQLSIYLADDYYWINYPWLIWNTFVIGWLVIAMIGFILLVLTGHAASTQSAVDRGVRQIREMRDERELVLESLDEGIITLDKTGVVTYVNKAALFIMGYEAKDLLLKTWGMILENQNGSFGKATQIEEVIFNTLKDGETRRILDDCLWHKAGRLVPVEYSCAAVIDGEKEIDGVVVVFRDVTERKSAEEKLSWMQEHFTQSQKIEALGKMAGGISHEFNNLLQGILGYTGLLLAGNETLESKSRQQIEIISTIAHRGKDLTRSMLAYAHQGKYANEAVNIKQVAVEVKNILAPTISKSIEFKLLCDSDDVWVHGDATQFIQMLMNLCINACDAISGSGTLTLNIEQVACDGKTFVGNDALDAGRYIRISVRDTGEGIESAAMQSVFDPFYTTKEVGSGTGLGLSMVYGCVKNHNGGISVSSVIGEGTLFRILLPRVSRDDISDSLLVNESLTNSSSEKCFADVSVLIIDDEAIIRDVIKLGLIQKGASVMTAEDGRRGVALFKENHDKIDVIILDYTMPGLNGVETFAELKKIAPDIQVIIASGYADQADILSLRESEPSVSFIQKPYKIQELAAFLNRNQ